MSPAGTKWRPSPGSAFLVLKAPLDTLEVMRKQGFDKLPELEVPEEILRPPVDRRQGKNRVSLIGVLDRPSFPAIPRGGFASEGYEDVVCNCKRGFSESGD